MKFAIRDDDLNYFFNPEDIERNYADIWDVCPISLSVVPYIKGNWPKFVKEAEKQGPGVVDPALLKNILSDDKVYPIGDNERLVRFIREKIEEKRAYLTIHAITHRNEDKVIPQFTGNFGIGAEFYTDRDLSEPLARSIEYLEMTFGQKIDVFTAPQNLLNSSGLNALLKNGLSICTDLPSPRKMDCLRFFGIREYMKYLFFKIIHPQLHYPFLVRNGRFRMIGHHRLQPGTDVSKLYTSLEDAYRFNGCFVLSTHSYGFDFKMKNTDARMGEILISLVKHARQKPNVQFTNLEEIFH